MHFHPFGVPVDELIVVAVNALQTPPSFYLELVRGWLRRLGWGSAT